jgi:hypothetical protein
MFGLVVRFELLEGHEEAFDWLVAETLPEIRSKEPGTVQYVTHRVVGSPLSRVFYRRSGNFRSSDPPRHRPSGCTVPRGTRNRPMGSPARHSGDR